MDQDCVKLTSFSDDGCLSGGSGPVAARLLLRGTGGARIMHQVRTGTTADHAPGLTGSGLVTLEKARLLSNEIDPVGLRDNATEATKLAIYLSRADQVFQVPAYEVICELLHRRGIAGATVLAGVDGNGQRARFASRPAATPMMIEAVTHGDRLGPVLPEIGGLLRRPVFTLETVRLRQRDGTSAERPLPEPVRDETGTITFHKLAVYASRSARHEGEPLHRAIVRRLGDAGVATAVTVPGLWGFHGDRLPRGGRLHAPAVTVAAVTAEHLTAAFCVIDELTTEHGLVTSNTVTGLLAPGPGKRRRRIRPER
jgi:PII-like signaling protein